MSFFQADTVSVATTPAKKSFSDQDASDLWAGAAILVFYLLRHYPNRTPKKRRRR